MRQDFLTRNHFSRKELISYTGKSGNDLTGITRGASGTATCQAQQEAHSDGATVYDANDYVGWGSKQLQETM
jgi:hypothetical protein